MLIQERINIILKMHNLTPSAFADQIGVQRSNISHVLSGRNKPGLDFLEKVIRSFPRVNAHWLLTGEMPYIQEDAIPENPHEQQGSTVPITPKHTKKGVEIDRIVIFYSDNSFQTYSPSEE